MRACAVCEDMLVDWSGWMRTGGETAASDIASFRKYVARLVSGCRRCALRVKGTTGENEGLVQA